MSKTQYTQRRNINTAFGFVAPSPVKLQEEQQQEQQQQAPPVFQRHNSSDETSSCCASSTASVSPYANFTQEITGPTFVPVFASVQDILPHHNSSAKGQVPWRCARCPEIDAFGHKCPSCGRARDTAALRVFMGQLSKEGDVELITKMLEVLCPDSFSTTRNLLHIEPHTHAGSGRGKGCAWVYVSSLQDVLYLVKRLHKRTYPTVNAQTGEVGFVAFPDSFSESDIKAAFDNDVTFLSQETLQLFHRSPITCEVPLTLQRSMEMNVVPAPAPAPVVVEQQQQRHHHQAHFQQQQQVQQVQPQQQQPVVAAPTATTTVQHNTALSKLPPKAFVFRSFVDLSPKTGTSSSSSNQPQFPSLAIEETNNNTINNQEEEQEIPILGAVHFVDRKGNSINNTYKRYRWNPYSNAVNRVGVH